MVVVVVVVVVVVGVVVVGNPIFKVSIKGTMGFTFFSFKTWG